MINIKILRLIPFALLFVYYIVKYFFKNISDELNLFMLFGMIVISLAILAYVSKKSDNKKQKINGKLVLFSIGIIGSISVFVYFYFNR